MNQNISTLFSYFRLTVKNLHKNSVANTCLNKGKGNVLLRRARQYKRPEDLEDPFYYGVGPKEKVEHVYQSLKARGFGKELQSYSPPTDVQDQIHSLCKKVFGSQLSADWKNQSLSDRVLKYKLLTKAIEVFDKDIPNSELHKIKEVKDLYEYFSTPVEGRSHYDLLVQNRNTLPPNLQVLPEAPRFNPSTDTFFSGVTAYPGRRRTIFTKEGEKFEKIIEWPHI